MIYPKFMVLLKPIPLALSFCLFSSSIFAENRALIIGIDKYPNLPKENQLHGPVNDANDIKKLVISKLPFLDSQIKVLLNKNATRKGILNAFNTWLINDTKAGDKVFFYYSGHGDHIKDQYPFDENGADNDGYDEALAPYDVSSNGKEHINLIRDDELRDLFKRLENKKIETIAMFDSCFSGSVTRGLGSFSDDKVKAKTISKPILKVINTRGLNRVKKDATFIESSPYLTVWTAASPQQLSYISVYARNSVFTGLFIDGMNSGKVINAELLRYITKESDKFCKNSKKCRLRQSTITPTLEISPEKQLHSFSQTSFSLPPESNNDAINNATSSIEWKNLSVKIREGNRISLNKSIRIDIENHSKKEGQLIVLDHRSDGSLVQLYPNKFRKKNTVKAKGKFWVPKTKASGFGINASVKGDSEILAILIHDKVNLDKVFQQTKDLEIIPVESANDYLGELLQTLNETWVEDIQNHRVEYSAGRFPYTVK